MQKQAMCSVSAMALARGGQRGGEGPGAGGHDVGREQHPEQRGQRIPAMAGLLRRRIHRLKKNRPSAAEMVRLTWNSVRLRHTRCSCPRSMASARPGTPAPARMLAGDAGHAHPDGVDAVAHRGFGQAPVARHVPAARQRLGLAGVAPQQVVVGVDLAGHDDGFERQRGRSATRAVTAPVDPVPGLAGMAGPARAQSSGSVTGRQAGPSAGRAPSGRAWAMRTSRIRAAQSPAASAVAARAPPHRISSASRPSIAASAVRRAAPPASAASIEQAARARAWMARVREDTASLR